MAVAARPDDAPSTPTSQSAEADHHPVVVARQPITDRQGTVVAFELLYRPGRWDPPAATGDDMTAQVLLGALSIGVDRLVGHRWIFCNAERGVLLGETPVALPPERTVVEVLETVAIDDEIVAGCRRLREAGFTIALDDFVWREGAERLLELARVVKVDFLAVPEDELPALVARCREYDVLLLAEKVETAEQMELARSLGFDLFQGYAIERPALVHGHTVGTSQASQVQLAVTLLSEDLDFEEVEEVLRREPGLVVQLLHLASIGSRGGLRGQVRTVREAMVLLGTTRIRQWVALTILGSQPSGRPDALAAALVRARMCELLAGRRRLDTPDFAFTAALLSALDLLLGICLTELATSVDVDETLKAAAFRQSGPVGELVAEVVAYQRHLARGSTAGLAGEELDEIAAEAFAWALPYVAGLES
jgi:EAL and modified HD-GYP domain-containing signal transduction protein